MNTIYRMNSACLALGLFPVHPAHPCPSYPPCSFSDGRRGATVLAFPMSKSILAALLLAASSLSAADLSKTAASAINDFGIDLLAHAAKPQENTALSPYSIQIALAMTFAGAEGG